LSALTREDSPVSIASQRSVADAAGAVCVGHPQFLDPDLADLSAAQGPAAAWTAAFTRWGTDAPSRVRGDFAVAVRDDAARTLLAVDRFSIRTLCYRVDGNELRFAERADELGDAALDLDPQAVLDYLYYHVIPAPRTIFRGVHRLPAGHCALFEAGRLSVKRWWTPEFKEDRAQPLASLGQEFRELLRLAIAEQANRGSVGCFLSGGTDSSTVVGTLGLVTGTAPRTFSIGFDAQGYDEMAYARIAARHFNAEHHEYYVTPDDVARSIPEIAAACDQPFGNSSVVPAYYCAKMAKDAGIETLLAGDGGDELFGGNTRYVHQRLLAIYGYLPAYVRARLLEPLLLGHSGVARVPGLRKARSYVEQARAPMPDRMQGYNLLLRLGIGEVLTPEFRSAVDPELPLREQRATYTATAATTLLNHMLAYDWKYTLADNDLPKVNTATSLAGVAAGFPLLDDRLVDFSLGLQSSLKVRGLALRWFFKKALRGFLPAPIIAKRKHGFGLPFGVWMTRDARLKALAMDSLDLLRNRGIVRPDFLDRLTRELLPQHPGYYGEMVWILMMLAQWRATMPGRVVR
jgi:asparagine synthase (glutamine-hydrolysing)